MTDCAQRQLEKELLKRKELFTTLKLKFTKKGIYRKQDLMKETTVSFSFSLQNNPKFTTFRINARFQGAFIGGAFKRGGVYSIFRLLGWGAYSRGAFKGRGRLIEVLLQEKGQIQVSKLKTKATWRKGALGRQPCDNGHLNKFL